MDLSSSSLKLCIWKVFTLLLFQKDIFMEAKVSIILNAKKGIIKMTVYIYQALGLCQQPSELSIIIICIIQTWRPRLRKI